MKKLTNTLAVFFILLSGTFASVLAMGANKAIAAPCSNGTFFGLPSWHKYLDGESYTNEDTNATICTPKINGLNDTWKIVAAVIELLLRLASLVAIGLVVWGGISYILSQGAPDKTKQSLQTIINALIGLVISIIAATLVSFIANQFTDQSSPATTYNSAYNMDNKA